MIEQMNSFQQRTTLNATTKAKWTANKRCILKIDQKNWRQPQQTPQVLDETVQP